MNAKEARQVKRAAAAILALVMALGLTGCASIFDKSYFSSSEYVSEPRETYASGSVEVSSYLELTLAINNLVSEHEDSLTIHFTAYEGDMQEDLAAACREVSTDTALGAYAVDYITYDLDRIVAYYEAEVYVYYKRSAEELDEIVSVNTADDLYNAICGMLEELDTRLVAMVGASSVDEEAVLGYVDEAYFSDPLSCVERPEATVNVYTGGGFQRIVELELYYGATSTALTSRKGALENVINRLAGSATSENEAYRALQCAVALTSECGYSENASSTLWSALMAGEADSEGIALAYKALCDAAGIECVVVEGRFDRSEHYWNIITIDGYSYHADISRAMDFGFGSTFLVSDGQMWGSYWWDNQEYPECSGPLTYSALVSGETAPATDTHATEVPESAAPEATAQASA